MLGVSATFGTLTTTLIPILSWGDKDAKIPLPEGWFLLAPPGLMLLSAVCFALGYFPRSGQLNPNELADVSRFRAKALTARRRLAALGLFLFSLSVLLTVVVTVIIRARSST
jgi:O-antigen/teichoic acid export membrane protein